MDDVAAVELYKRGQALVQAQEKVCLLLVSCAAVNGCVAVGRKSRGTEVATDKREKDRIGVIPNPCLHFVVLVEWFRHVFGGSNSLASLIVKDAPLR